jgi:hypothetical protein
MSFKKFLFIYVVITTTMKQVFAVFEFVTNTTTCCYLDNKMFSYLVFIIVRKCSAVHFLLAMGVAIYPALLTTIVWPRLWPSSGCEPLVNFWDILIKDESREAVAVALEIYSGWFFFYSFMYLLTYEEPQRSLFRPIKFHKNYPNHSLVVKGVGVAAIFSIIVNKLYFHNFLPSIYVPKLLILSELKELRVAHFFAGLAVFAWADFHQVAVQNLPKMEP